jgi:hypothetical protein
MSNFLDYTDYTQFPKIGGFIEHLNSRLTYKKIWNFSTKRYDEYQDPYNEMIIVSDKEREQDIKTCIADLKNQLINISNTSFINQLINERDLKLSISIPTNEHREHTIKLYNKTVLDELENFFESIFENMSFIFCTHFNKTHKEELKLRTIFRKWYDTFEYRISIDRVGENNAKEETKKFERNNFNPKIKSVQAVTDFFTKELKPYADELVINEFLSLAFEKCEPPKEKLSFTNLNYNKKKIMNVFNTFYNACGKTQSNATKYAELLGNYFTGFETETVRTNWAK